MKKTLLLILVLIGITISNTYAQSKKITGKVVGADDGAPIPGVSVIVKGTKRGVITDANGQFSLQAANGETLVASFVGYSSASVPVTTANSYQIKLTTDTRQLSEVIINDGYSIQAKKAYTGAAATVSGRDNENKPFSTPLEALQGELPGVQVAINSGQPGANQSVRIRGVNSFAAGNEPLYVIDGMIINAGNLARVGVPNTNVLAGLNEDDIESFTVLKDASATAIYGSRGSNGVILITTKKGKSGKTQVRLDVEGGIDKNLPLPSAGVPLTGTQYSNLFITGLSNAGLTTTAQQQPYITSYGLFGPSNNWYNLVTQRGHTQQYNASITGGDENTKIFSSLGYFKQDAPLIYSNLTRITGTLNVDHNITKRVSSSFTLNVSNINQNAPYNSGYFANPLLAAYFLRPEQLAYTPSGAINNANSGNTNFSSIYNPLWTGANDIKLVSQTHILAGESLRWNIIDNLNFTSFTSIDYQDIEETQFLNGILGDGASLHGSATAAYTRYFNWLSRNQFEYRYNIASDFYADAIAGYEAQQSNSRLLTAAGNTFPATQPLLTSLAVASNPTTASDSFSDYTFDAVFARLAVNYHNIYSLTGSIRRDGSSRFGVNKQYGTFASIGGAVNIENYDFFKKQDVVSSAKLRASIGSTGNANLGNYAALPTVGYGGNYAGGNAQIFNTIGNVNLTWESQTKADVGLDFGFFKDRLTFSLDYYNNNINGLIQNAPIAWETGFTSITENIGVMRNRGIEAAVKGIAIKLPSFSWTTSFNIAYNANTVLSTSTAPGANGNYYLGKGNDYYTFYQKLYAGVDPSNGNALWYTDGSKTATTTSYSAAQYAKFRQADPKLFGGFNNTFNYKGISLSVDFYYNFGNTIYDSYGQYLTAGAYYTYNKYQYIYNNAWTTPGQITNVPKYVAGGIAANGGNDGAFSTRYFYYGDFIRLKNASLGYDFKNIDYLKQFGIGKLYVYGRVTNLWTKTYDKRLPFDPEVQVGGASNIDQPQSRTFTLGLNVGF